MAQKTLPKTDVRSVVARAVEPNDRKSHSFHLSTARVVRFKKASEKLNRSAALLIEVFMDDVSAYADIPVEESKKQK